MQYFGDASLRVSFAASVVFHVAVFGALALVTSGLEGKSAAQASPVKPDLEVALTSRLDAADAASATPTAVILPPPPVVVAAASEPALLPSREPSRAPAPSPPNPGDASGLTRPSVSVTDRFPTARFGDFLDGDRLAGFPREIDTPVRLSGNLDVPYPPAALAAHEEGDILVFAVIAADGSVEQSHLQSEQMSPELEKAVEEALKRTRFLPAEDGGKAIRFYTTLKFTFRLESPDGSTPADGDASALPAQTSR